ncbi:zinc finger BED domain-containing protein RICESLEEPER 2 [Tanacetum coccineum]
MEQEEFNNFDILSWWKGRQSQFPVLSIMARDLLSVQASTVASESAFSLSGRVLSIRRTRFTPASLEMCICLKDHIDAQERIQHTSNLEGDCLEIKQQLHEVELEAGYPINIVDEEIVLEEQAMSGSGRPGFTNVSEPMPYQISPMPDLKILISGGKAIYARPARGVAGDPPSRAKIDHEFGLDNQSQDSLEFSIDVDFDVVDFKQGMDDLDFDVVTKNISQNNPCVKVAMKCSASTKSIRSGSHTDIGARRSNEDQHIHIDDVANHLGDDVYKWAALPSSFYAVFDGHGGTEAASYVKEHAMRLFFESSDLPKATTLDGSVDELFLKELQDFHCKAFLQADKDLKEECSISDYCGTTALTVLVIGRHLLISNAGDCRVVISRKGVAKQIKNEMEGTKKLLWIEDGYLNDDLAVKQAFECRRSAEQKQKSI